MSHGTHCMPESRHTVYTWVTVWTSHGTHMNEVVSPVNGLWHTYEWVMSHIWPSQITHTYGTCHMHEAMCILVDWMQQLFRLWITHSTHMNESWHTYEWIMAHTYEAWIRQRPAQHTNESDTDMNETWQIYEQVMAHTWMSHGTRMRLMHEGGYHACKHMTRQHMNASSYECIIIWMHHSTHLWIRHPHAMNAPCHAYVISRIRMRHVTHTKESWPVVHMILFLRMYEPCHAYKCMCHVTHTITPWLDTFVRHDSFISGTHACDLTHSYVGRDPHTHTHTHTH